MKTRSVYLPGGIGSVEIPEIMATTLELIIQSGENGISIEQLANEGVYSAGTYVSKLRKLNAQITTVRRPEIDIHGKRHNGVGFYVYEGWIFPRPLPTTPTPKVVLNEV